ncbi:ABC transporter permease [Caldicellulosiruptor morganii]|uniref:ABC transporter permease n=1 Tax=Caldicellulosiruptor morganii TaxID=1387555 RepID=A0ABY7BM90_9FIRM|nr:FtsX-like permease family protein [Caldicellulosiruptor morganii]WAM33957.1 ABC transporter permease [Caldicellulosiruptor morganii]
MGYVKFLEAFKIAAKSLVYNKTRTFLSVLGVIIGICSIIVSVGLVQSVSISVSKQLEESGLDSLILILQRDVDINEMFRYLNDGQNLLVGITPKKTYYTEVLSSDGKKYKCEVLLLKSSSYVLENLKLVKGRFLSSLDEEKLNNVAVVFENQVDKLFNSKDNVLFKKLFIGGEEFEVIGTVAKQKRMTDFSIGTSYYDINIIIPYKVGESLFNLEKSSKIFFIKSINSKYNSRIKALLEKYLQSKGLNKEDYGIMDGRELVQSVATISYLLSGLLGGVAAVSLIVSGIGIMNIILVSVTERTKEIGIRKAVGAKSSDIWLQFLIESLLISSFGCFIGILLGLSIVYGILPTVLNTEAHISPMWIIISMGICYLIGLFASWTPAERASRLDPIVALRYE